MGEYANASAYKYSNIDFPLCKYSKYFSGHISKLSKCRQALTI